MTILIPTKTFGFVSKIRQDWCHFSCCFLGFFFVYYSTALVINEIEKKVVKTQVSYDEIK